MCAQQISHITTLFYNYIQARFVKFVTTKSTKSVYFGQAY